MSYFLCNFRNQGKEVGEEEKPVFPGDETNVEVPPLTILEFKRSRAAQTILENKPVFPGDEEPTKPSEEEKPVCPGDENIDQEVGKPPSTPVRLVEVTKNKGEVTIFKEKSKKKKWHPFKKSHKVIERRNEQQIVEYGPPEEPCKEDEPICLEDENITYEEVSPLTIREVKNSHASQIILEDKPVSPGDDETPMDSKVDEAKVFEEEKPVSPGDENMNGNPTRVCEDLPRTKNQLRVVSLNMKSFLLSFILAVIIFVGVKVALPEVNLQMISGMSMIGFFVSLLVQQLFNSNNKCCQCHVLSGEECTCHTLFGIYFGILI